MFAGNFAQEILSESVLSWPIKNRANVSFYNLGEVPVKIGLHPLESGGVYNISGIVLNAKIDLKFEQIAGVKKLLISYSTDVVSIADLTRLQTSGTTNQKQNCR